MKNKENIDECFVRPYKNQNCESTKENHCYRSFCQYVSEGVDKCLGKSMMSTIGENLSSSWKRFTSFLGSKTKLRK